MTPLPDVLPIRPFTRPARGEVPLPGSKSITNRALLLAALCHGPVTLTGALFSEDTEIMAKALDQLGIAVKSDPEAKVFQVAGQGGNISEPKEVIQVGNAGTAARFLTALCASAKGGTFRLDGVPQMRKRPMQGLIDALRSLGADIRCPGAEGFFPLEIHAHGLNPKNGQVKIDASESSQMLSALLMVMPPEEWQRIAPTKAFRKPFVDMTRAMMASGGFPAPGLGHRPQFGFVPSPSHLYNTLAQSGGVYPIEADATAASYFLALPFVVGGQLTLLEMPDWPATIQMDGRRFVDVMGRVGEPTDISHPNGPQAGIVVTRKTGSPLRGVAENFNEFSDTFLTLAAIAPLLDGPTTITGIAHTRKQETDRVAGMARELAKLGQGVVETADSLSITPNLPELKKRAAQDVTGIETYGDHRFAMSFAILGCHDLRGDGRPWLAIRNPACCAKTFPNFFDVLAEVWKTSHAGQPSSSS